MSKSYSLNTQTRYIWAILGRHNSPLTEDFHVYYDRLKRWINAVDPEIYAFIGHDKDVDDEGSTKFRHIHLLVVLKKDTRSRLITTLNRISDVVGIDPTDIDIEVADNVDECIRYCVHKGYETKYQYPIDELQTNLDPDELAAVMTKEIATMSANYLITACKINGYSAIALMRSLGLKAYMKYRNAIRDICEEVRSN